jgi:hypothetical protein
MLFMKEDGQVQSHPFALMGYDVFKQATLNVLRQMAPNSDNRFA